VLSALQGALEKAFGTTLRFSALVAFGVPATPFSFAGITSAFWAIVAGLVAALLVERSELLSSWHSGQLDKSSNNPISVDAGNPNLLVGVKAN
jgi:hypothetical protein